MTTFLSPTFTGSAGTPLDNYVDNNGVTWLRNTHTGAANTIDLDGAGGVYANGTGSNNWYYANTSPPGTDYTVTCTLQVKSVVAGDLIALLLREASSAFTGYEIYAEVSANTLQLWVQKAVNGTLTAFTGAGQHYTYPTAPQAGDTHPLEVVITTTQSGPRIDIYDTAVSTSTPVATVTDTSASAIASAGFVGFAVNSAVDGAATGLHLASLVATGTGATSPTVSYSNTAWVYSPWNWTDTGAGSACTIYPGAYARIAFYNSVTCQGLFDLSHSSTPYPALAWRLDGGPWQKATLAASIDFTGGTPLLASKHLLEIVLDASSTNNMRWPAQTIGQGPPTAGYAYPDSALYFQGLVLDGGASVEQPSVQPKNVLFYGDSIAEGIYSAIVTLNPPLASTGDTVANSSAVHSWLNGLHQALPAEIGACALAGIGVVSNAPTGAGSPALSTGYNQIIPNVARAFSQTGPLPFRTPAPDAIVVMLGQNDSGNGIPTATFQADVATLISELKGLAPNAAQLWLVTFSGAYAAQIAAAVAAATAAGTTGIHTYNCYSPAMLNLPYPTHSPNNLQTGTYVTPQGDSIDGTHPLGAANYEKVVPALAPVISNLLGGFAAGSGILLPAGFTGGFNS